MSDCTVKSTIESGHITAYVTGRVDGSNATEFGEQLKAAHDENPDLAMVVDARGLEYISSAGLRALLTLKKYQADLSIQEASDEVMDVFKVTGFTRMLEVTPALREVSVEGLTVLSRGMKGATYRVDDDTMLSVYSPEYPLSTVELERKNAQEALVAGASVIISFETVRVGEGYGIVYEAPNAKTVSEVLGTTADEATAHAYGVKVGKVIRRLHGAKGDRALFIDKKAQAIRQLKGLAENGFLPAEQLQPAIDLYEALPESDSILHGDLSPLYIVERTDEMLLMDMVDAGIGHPVIDLAAAYTCYITSHEVRKELAAQLYGVSSETLTTMWGDIMRTYFGTEDEGALAANETLIKAVARIRPLLLISWLKTMPEEYIDAIKMMWPQRVEDINAALAYLKENPEALDW